MTSNLQGYSDRQDQTFLKPWSFGGSPFCLRNYLQWKHICMFTCGVTAPVSVHRETFAHTLSTRIPDVFITCPMRQLRWLGASSNYSQSGGDLWSSRLPLYMSASGKGQHRNEKWLQEHNWEHCRALHCILTTAFWKRMPPRDAPVVHQDILTDAQL